MTLSYLYAKVFKKILRGKAIYKSQIEPSTKVNSGCSITNCTIGRYNNIGYDNEINNTEIGNFCSFSDHVFIGGDEHPLEWVSTSPVFESVKNSGPKRKFASFDVPEGKRTIIGSDVWIAHGVCIKRGGENWYRSCHRNWSHRNQRYSSLCNSCRSASQDN